VTTEHHWAAQRIQYSTHLRGVGIEVTTAAAPSAVELGSRMVLVGTCALARTSVMLFHDQGPRKFPWAKTTVTGISPSTHRDDGFGHREGSTVRARLKAGAPARWSTVHIGDIYERTSMRLYANRLIMAPRSHQDNRQPPRQSDEEGLLWVTTTVLASF
jgi:hypothetical protein